MCPFVTSVSMLIDQVPWYRPVGQDVSRHSWTTRVMVNTHRASSKVLSLSLFSKSLEVCRNSKPKTTKVLKTAALAMTVKHEEKGKQETPYLDFGKLSLIRVPYLHECKRETKMTQTTPPPCHQEGHKQSMEEHMTQASLRPGVPGSRGHRPNPLSGLHCARIQPAPARPLTPGCATGW
jgi:hypothetical protein